MEIRIAIITIIICSLSLLLLFKKLDLMEVFAISLPMKGIAFDFGLDAYFYQIILLFVILSSLFNIKKWAFNFSKFYFIFVAYVILGTIIICTLFTDFQVNDYSNTFFRTNGRYISTLIKFSFFEVGIVIILFNRVTNNGKTWKLIALYIRSVIFLSVLGIFQVLISAFWGLNLFPLIILENGEVRNDLESLLGGFLPFVRLSSLGGEPKGMACSIIVAISLLLLMKKLNKINNPKFNIYFFILIVGNILTFSTSGYILSFIIIVLNIIWKINNISQLRLSFKSIFFLIFIAILLFIFKDIFSEIYQTRIYERIDEVSKEEVDQVIMDFLIKNPKWLFFGSGSGNIHNLASYLLYDYHFSAYLENNIFVSRYGYLKLISENGFLGFFLFLFFIFEVILRILKYLKNSNKEKSAILFIFVLLFLFFMARANYVVCEFYFVTGICLAFCRNSLNINKMID